MSYARSGVSGEDRPWGCRDSISGGGIPASTLISVAPFSLCLKALEIHTEGYCCWSWLSAAEGGMKAGALACVLWEPCWQNGAWEWCKLRIRSWTMTAFPSAPSQRAIGSSPRYIGRPRDWTQQSPQPLSSGSHVRGHHRLQPTQAFRWLAPASS